jgi:hypothetical protein
VTGNAQQQALAPVLLAVLEYGELPELLRVAETVRSVLAAPAIFFFVKHSYRRLDVDTAEVVARGFGWMDSDGALHDRPADTVPAVADANQAQEPSHMVSITFPTHAERRSNPARRLAMARLPFAACAFLLDTFGGALRSTARECANFMRDRRRFRARFEKLSAILARHRPALLVVGQDGPGSDLSLLLIAAGRHRIPRLVTPFAMFAIEETAEYAAAREEHQVHATALNRLVAKAFPQWMLAYKGQSLLRLPGYRALALETTGLINGLPWTPLSEPAEAITADSRVAADALIRLGIQPDRLHVIGSPVQDRLARNLEQRASLKKRICEEHGLDPAKPLVLCGWPVNIFSWLSGRPIAYPDYESVALAWARVLADVRDRHLANVVVSIHPKTLRHEYTEAERAGLPCLRGGVEELMAACDVFTTLNGSSITSWAIACSKPVLLFDCFQTRYPDFLDVPGCVTVQTESAFANHLNALCAEPERRAELADRQGQAAADWGKLDGHAGERLGELINRLTKEGAR